MGLWFVSVTWVKPGLMMTHVSVVLLANSKLSLVMEFALPVWQANTTQQQVLQTGQLCVRTVQKIQTPRKRVVKKQNALALRAFRALLEARAQLAFQGNMQQWKQVLSVLIALQAHGMTERG